MPVAIQVRIARSLVAEVLKLRRQDLNLSQKGFR